MSKGQHGWYSAEEKSQIINEYFESNCKIKDFAIRKDIREGTLRQWLKIYDVGVKSFQDITPIIKQEVIGNNLLQENININDNKQRTLKISLENGISIEFDISALKQVISELK